MNVRVNLVCSLNVAEQSRDKLRLFLVEKLPDVRRFSGCIYVKVLFSDDKHLLLEEEWQSVEHHQQYMAHVESNSVLTQLMQFFTGQPEIRYFKLSDL